MVPASPRGAHSVAGHWALWQEGIEHGDISVGNLMYDPDSHRGVLNDFDLARSRAAGGKPSSKDNTGTLPFLALDLLCKGAFDGLVQRLYRHDAESFTWCLIYICICMKKDDNGQIRTITPHPLSSWSANVDSCSNSKKELSNQGSLPKFPLHQKTKPLAACLYRLWVERYRKQFDPGCSADLRQVEVNEALPPEIVQRKETVRRTEQYKELPNEEWFGEFFQLIIDESNTIPREKMDDFIKMIKTVKSLYSSVAQVIS